MDIIQFKKENFNEVKAFLGENRHAKMDIKDNKAIIYYNKGVITDYIDEGDYLIKNEDEIKKCPEKTFKRLFGDKIIEALEELEQYKNEYSYDKEQDEIERY